MSDPSREKLANRMFWAIVAAIGLGLALMFIPESESKVIWMGAIGILTGGLMMIVKAPRWFVALYAKRTT